MTFEVGGNNPSKGLFVATDGGVMFADLTDPQNIDWETKNGIGLNITQFHGLGSASDQPLTILCGAQDNNAFAYQNSTWTQPYNSGDGGDGVIEKGNPMNWYIEHGSQNPDQCAISNDGGQNWTGSASSGLFSLETYADQKSSANEVYRTVFGRITTKSSGWNNLVDFINTYNVPYCVAYLRGLTIVETENPQMMYAYFLDPTNNINLCSTVCTGACLCPGGCCPLTNKLWRSTNAGSTWIDITSKFDQCIDNDYTDAFRWNGAYSVAINSDDPQEAWVSFYNFSESTQGVGKNRVNHTTDGGEHWEEFSSGLTGFPTNRILYQKGSNGALYLATDVGVYYRDNSMSQWECFSDGLPVVLITDLEINYCTQKLIAATYGRGMYIADLVPTEPETLATTTIHYGNISIYGDVFIPSGSNLIIDASSTINMAVGRSITIASGGKLIIHNSTLKNLCDYMWRGIIVESGGTLFIEGSSIEDAQYGVDARDGAILTLVNSTFDRDYVGLFVGPDGGNTNNITAKIFNCNFSCSDHLKLPYPDQTPLPLTTTFAGIEIHDLALLNIVGYGSFVNTFDHLNYGIYSENSNVSMWRPQLSNIQKYDNYIVPDINSIGSGVYSRGTGAERVYVRGNGLGSGVNTFDNCKTGVYCDRTNTTVEATRMIDMKKGVSISNGHNLGISVVRNLIEAEDNGIFLRFNDGSRYLTVQDNQINISSAIANQNLLRSGIFVSEFGNSNSLPWIFNNTIDFTANFGNSGNVLSGIYLTRAEGYTVQNNSITMDNSSYLYSGISLNSCNESSIECNSISATPSFSLGGLNQNQDGISVSASLNYFIKCNHTDQSFRGFLFNFTNIGNPASIFESNDINTHYFGLYVTDHTWIDPQPLRGNLWHVSNFSPGIGAINNNIPGRTIDRFDYSISGLPLNLPAPRSPNWFFVNALFDDETCGDPNAMEYYCNDLGPIKHFNSGSNSITATDLRIATNNFHSTRFDEFNNWYAKRFLMEKLILDTNLISKDTSIANFYTANSSNNVGEFASLGLEMKSLFLIDSISELGLESSELIFDRNNSSIVLNDSLILLDSSLTSEEIAVLESENSIYSDSIFTSYAASISLNDSIANFISNRADSLVNLFSSVDPTTDLEEDEKYVNLVYLATVAKGKTDSVLNYAEAISTIANKCFSEGGHSVFGARGLYSFIADSLYYKDNGCQDTCTLPDLPGTISGPISGQCGQTGVSFSITPVSGATSYTWTVSDTNSASFSGLTGLSASSVDFSNSFNSVTIFVQATNTCGSGDPAALVIKAGPETPDTILGNTYVCAYDVESYTASASGATGFSWSVPSGSTILSTSGGSMLLYWGASGGDISVRALNACDTSEEYVLTAAITCKLGNHRDNLFKVFPNPTSGQIVIEGAFTDQMEFQLFDYLGHKVQQSTLIKNQGVQTINLNEVQSGIYQYKIICNNDVVAFDKLVIIKN